MTTINITDITTRRASRVTSQQQPSRTHIVGQLVHGRVAVLLPAHAWIITQAAAVVEEKLTSCRATAGNDEGTRSQSQGRASCSLALEVSGVYCTQMYLAGLLADGLPDIIHWQHAAVIMHGLYLHT